MGRIFGGTGGRGNTYGIVPGQLELDSQRALIERGQECKFVFGARDGWRFRSSAIVDIELRILDVELQDASLGTS